MLKSFFAPNSPFRELASEQELLDQLEVSGHLQNLLYRPDRLAPPRPKNRIAQKIFENVSFAKTTLEGLEFRDCIFKDCLFIGASLVDCEFHDCRFEGINPHKIHFAGTYLDPEAFAGVLDKKNHANIGVHLFQQLYQNSAAMHQTKFARSAEYHFKRWQRFYLNYERREGRRQGVDWLGRWLPNFLYQCTAGYGLRTKFFAVWTAVTLCLVVLVNNALWVQFAVRNQGQLVTHANLIRSFYFSVVTMATVGFGDFVPTSSLGQMVVGLEALLGVVWLSLFAATLVKRVAR